jgi:hypothetical protein
MSMIGYMLRVPQATVDQIGDDHELWDGVIGLAIKANSDRTSEQMIVNLPEDARVQARERRNKYLKDWRSKLSGELASIVAAAEANESRAKPFIFPAALCVDRAWDVLHHALSNDDTSSGLFEGRMVGVDRGYGQSFLRNVAQTAAFADLLDRHAPADLLATIDPDPDRIYAIPRENSADAVAEVLEHYYPLVRAYVGEARANKDALLIWVS